MWFLENEHLPASVGSFFIVPLALMGRKLFEFPEPRKGQSPLVGSIFLLGRN
jgi:hypothetical protein